MRVRFPAVQVLRREEPGGFCAAANAGLASARGELLFLLNSDTEVPSDCLERFGRAFEADPGLGIAGARLVYPDGRAQWSGGREPGLRWFFVLASGLAAWLGRSALYRRLRPVAGTGPEEVAWVTGAAMVLRRALWQEHGPFTAELAVYAQDLDLCLRARAAGWRVRVLPEVRVVHRQGATIGQTEGANEGQHLARLWLDLLTWAERARGGRWAAKARLCLLLGGRLRLLAGWCGRFVPRGQNLSARQRSDAALRAGLAALVNRRGGVQAAPSSRAGGASRK